MSAVSAKDRASSPRKTDDSAGPGGFKYPVGKVDQHAPLHPVRACGAPQHGLHCLRFQEPTPNDVRGRLPVDFKYRPADFSDSRQESKTGHSPWLPGQSRCFGFCRLALPGVAGEAGLADFVKLRLWLCRSTSSMLETINPVYVSRRDRIARSRCSEG